MSAYAVVTEMDERRCHDGPVVPRVGTVLGRGRAQHSVARKGDGVGDRESYVRDATEVVAA